ncbi:MAG: response regulator [Blastocatellia bacterium]
MILDNFLYDFLEPLGHKVIAVSNGKDALVEATVNLLDVILLDVMMPQMSGLEVCQIFTQINKVPKENLSLGTKQELFNKVIEKINSLPKDF